MHTYIQFLDFALLMDAKYSKHDPENDAWPSLIDAFVEAQQTPS